MELKETQSEVSLNIIYDLFVFVVTTNVAVVKYVSDVYEMNHINCGNEIK